jgi:hypothetical protein
MWLAQRHYELVGGMSAREWVCGPVALTGLFALLQRFIGLPTAPRLLTLAATGLMNLTTAHFTVLGRPHEGLLIVVALLAGDALGRPFELRRRAAYAREMAAGRALDASPDAAVHPVSLRFSDHALERAYAARCFKESYHMALPTGLGISAISFVLLAFAVPQTAPVGGAYVAPAVVALAFRVFQRGAADQARAHAQFEWLLAASVVVAASIVAVAQRQYVLVSGVPVERFAFVAATHTFCAPLLESRMPLLMMKLTRRPRTPCRCIRPTGDCRPVGGAAADHLCGRVPLTRRLLAVRLGLRTTEGDVARSRRADRRRAA